MKLNHIYLGNCFDLLWDIEPGTIDLLFTDPPYAKSLTELYKSWQLKNHDFEVLAEAFNHALKERGQIAIFGDYITQVAIANAFQRYFDFRFYWVWVKLNGQPTGKYQPISNVELISVWKKKGVKTSEVTYNPISLRRGNPYVKPFRGGNRTRKNRIKDYVTISNGDRYPDQVLCFPSKDNLPHEERTSHPTQKPLALCRYIIKTLSNPGDIVLDPFSGSGSIPIGAFIEGRQFIGIEKDEGYWQESVVRLRRYMAQASLFENERREGCEPQELFTSNK